MEKARGRIKKVREKWTVFPYTYCKMAFPESGGDKLHHRPQFKM